MGFCSSLSTCTGPSLARGEQRWLSRIYLDMETTKDIQNLNLSRQILAGGNHGELRTRRNRTSLGSCTTVPLQHRQLVRASHTEAFISRTNRSYPKSHLSSFI